MRALLQKPLVIIGIAIWIAVAGFGFRALILHEIAPGQASEAPSEWPRAARIPRSATRPTLIMVVHPQCSCTGAALGELALIMAQAPERADVHVLFFKPLAFSTEWAKSNLWLDANAIPGVDVRIDDQGKVAQTFGASTSGSVLRYDRDGHLIFEGGITPSRSHSGDNAGRSAIVSLLNGGKPERNRTFVFGCSLLDSRTPGDKPK